MGSWWSLRLATALLPATVDSMSKRVGVTFCHFGITALDFAMLVAFVARAQHFERIAGRGDGPGLA